MNRCFSPWLSCFAFITACASAAGQDADDPPLVPIARPVLREVADFDVFGGRAEAVERVELRCRVSGFLVKSFFQEGAEVKQGEVLFEIDSRPYRAELERAEAAVAGAEARLKLADANHKRLAALHARGGVTQHEVDKAAGERVEAEASLLSARAGRDVARLNMDFTRVSAPIQGRIGQRLIDPGNLVKADETSLAVIVSRDPLHVSFHVDERTFLRLQRSQREGGKVEKMAVDIALADDKGFPYRGVVNFVDNQVDPATGTLRVRAAIPNKEGLLTPGMSVRVRLTLGPARKALLIPMRAIMTDQDERFVYVVDAKNIVSIRQVKLGKEVDGLQEVQEGLKTDDRVVIGGLQQMRPGIKVTPRLATPPDKQPAKAPDGGSQSAAPLPRGAAGPGTLVEAAYPGASASVVSDAVRAPIEQMVGGMEKLRYMRSRCTNDGGFALSLAFDRRTDLVAMHALAQNRVSLAMPLLPNVVQLSGVKTMRGTSGVLQIVTFAARDDRYDRLFLSNYANIHLKDELARVAGVAEVALIGQTSSALRIWLDPEKLAERKLNATHIRRLLARDADADLDKLQNLIVKADADGRVVRLRDVARVDMGRGESADALVDGKPAVAVVIYALAGAKAADCRAALEKRLQELRDNLPDGLALDVFFDAGSAADHLLIDLDLPIAGAAGRTAMVRGEALARQAPGIQHALALPDNPFDLFGSGPCVLVRLKNAPEKHVVPLRKQLAALEEAKPRLRQLALANHFAYPIGLGLSGPEALKVQAWGKEVVARMARSKKFSDTWLNRDGEPRPSLHIDIDRDAAATRDVGVADIMETLRLSQGATLGDVGFFGRKWHVEVQTEGNRDLRQLKIRNSRGEMIPLNTVATIRSTTAPLALHFLDGMPMVEITANQAAGMSSAESRKLCEALAEEARKDLGLGRNYRLTWLDY